MMRKGFIVAALFLCMGSLNGERIYAGKTDVTAVGLTAEGLRDPMSLNTREPRLGWRIVSDKSNVRQTAYHIIVASTEEKAANLDGDLWNVTVKSDSSQGVAYHGQPLASDTRCYWRVKVSTTAGDTRWSAIAMWNVGLFESDWRGRWIGLDQAMPWDREDEHSRLSARYLRREITLTKQVRKATLYICGLGLYEAYINGGKIGADVLTPAPTDYRRTVLYNAYDVTPNLRNADSVCLAVILGNGRYYTMQQHKKTYKITTFGYPKMRLNLIITYDDGSRQTLVSDTKWKLSADGPIRSNNEYDGEIYDARKEMGQWMLPGYDDSGWMDAQRCAIPLGTPRGTMMEGMRVVKTFTPVSVTGQIVDFGQNMSGWAALRIRDVKEGDTIRVRYAEKLDSAGQLYTANLRHALSTDYYIADGGEQDRWWHPLFSYHGFRYVEISGISHLRDDDVSAEFVSNNLTPTGSFATNDTILNKVYHNAVMGIACNYKGMPVDCPQRDERQPWLGDRTRGCYGEAYVFDVHALYTKWTRDIAEAEREDGVIPDVAPPFWYYYSDNVTWPAAFPFALDMLYRQYGDIRPMTTCYPDVRRWMDHLWQQYGKGGLITKDTYGDWCVPPEDLTQIHSRDAKRLTDGTLISTAYYYRLCRLMAWYAARMGYDDDEKTFAGRSDSTRRAFNRAFLHRAEGTSAVPGHLLYPDSTYYGNGSLTANLLPLAFGIIDDDYVNEEVKKNIIKTIITDNNGHLSSGVIGTGWLMHALTDMGRTDIAWLLATTKSYPSWGYMTEHGATTIWELWNGDTANPAMNSGNHVMLLGDLISWLYECLAGIRGDENEPGFKHIILRPDFSVDEIDDINAEYTSVYGVIGSRWRKERGRLRWEISLPCNTYATVYMPDGSKEEMGSGHHVIDVPLTYPQGVIKEEFLYKRAPFPSCHAVTIAEARNGDLVAAYFGGAKERDPDVCVYVSRLKKGESEWEIPVMVADGVMKKEEAEECRNLYGWNIDGPLGKGEGRGVTDKGYVRYPCWNPVIYRLPDGTLRIDFKIGPMPSKWHGWYITSKNNGKTWSPRQPLPAPVNSGQGETLLGAVKNKPVTDSAYKGRLISPTSDESKGWKVYFEYSDDNGVSWRRTDFVASPDGIRAIQPTIIILPDGRLEALCRTRERYIASTFSDDGGASWSPLTLTDVPNNNSGIDAVSLKDGRYMLICNDYPIERGKQKGARTPLSLLISDDGLRWKHFLTLEDSPVGQYSYPSIIQTDDGHLHCVYTWRRQRVKHVELLPPAQ